MKIEKKRLGMTLEQAEAMKAFFAEEAKRAEPGPDNGTCVLGNGISVYVMEPRKRLPKSQYVFRNPWTQTEQYTAITKMIAAAKVKFPELAEFIRYECGNMD